MYIFILVLGLICAILLFLYITLKKECRSLYNQLDYTLKEGSTFTLFTNSSDPMMRNIMKKINKVKNEMLKEQHLHTKQEKEIQDMITNISHDIRTPLTSIQGYLEMMQYSEDIEDRQRYYEIIKHRLDDLEAMLDEFFLYTKLQNSDEIFTLEKQPVYPLVCMVLLNYRDLLIQHDLTPEIICEDEGVTAMIHEESFRRICMNLMINTIRYGSKPFMIHIQSQNDKVQIIFENSIHDLKNIDVEHMFDRFYKGSEARTQKGSGLGLAIVKELSERMQGNVSAQLKKDVLSIQIELKA